MHQNHLNSRPISMKNISRILNSIIEPLNTLKIQANARFKLDTKPYPLNLWERVFPRAMIPLSFMASCYLFGAALSTTNDLTIKISCLALFIFSSFIFCWTSSYLIIEPTLQFLTGRYYEFDKEHLYTPSN